MFEAKPFCTGWEVSFEKTYEGEMFEHNNASQVHDRFEICCQTKHACLSRDVDAAAWKFRWTIGGIIGLYIGWSFFSIGAFLLVKLMSLCGSKHKQNKKLTEYIT